MKEEIAQSNGELNLLRRRVADLERVEAKSRQIEEKLCLERDFNATLIQAAPLFFVAIGADGKTLMMNEAMLESLGYTADEIIDKDYLTTFVPERDRAALSRVFTTLTTSHEPTLNKNHVLTKGGRELLVEWHGRQVFKEDGALDFFFGAGVDITEAKRAERQIEHLNRVLRAVRNVNQLIVHEKDRDALIQRACDLLIETRGYHNAWIGFSDEAGKLTTATEAGLGNAFLPLAEQLKRGEWPVCAQRALMQSEAVMTENPHSTCTDCPLHENYAGRAGMTVRLDWEGKVYGLLSVSLSKDFAVDEEEQGLFEEIAEDIAFALHSIELEKERKQAEAKIRELSQFREGVIDNANVWLDVLDERGNVVVWNKAAEAISGYSRDEVVGHDKIWGWLYLDDEYRHYLIKKANEITANGKVLENFETTIRCKNGVPKVISWSSRNLLDEKGDSIGSIAIGQDITERKRAEALQVVSYRIADAALRSTDLKNLFSVIHEELSTLLNAENFYICLYDAEKKVLSFPYYVDENYPEIDVTATCLRPLGKGLTEYVITRGKGLLATEETIRQLAEKGKIEIIGTMPRIWLGVPLKIKERTIGIIAVQSYASPTAYTGQELKLLEFTSGQIAIAVERKRSEERYRTTFESTGTATVIIEEDMILSMINAKFEKLCGYSKEEIEGKKSWTEFVVEEDLEQTKGYHDSRRKEGQSAPTSYDFRFVTREGETRNILLEIGVIPGTKKSVASLLDITERGRAEEALRLRFVNLAETVSRIFGLRNPYVASHQQGTAKLARAVGEKMGLDEDRLQDLYIGSLLHDIGKTAVPEGILRKPGKLTEAERGVVRTHPQRGYDILKDTNLPPLIAELALQHHERLDGSGYPDGLKGDELSTEVRILAACNVVNAMSLLHPYRLARSKQEITEEITNGKGTKYDPDVVDVLVEMIENGELELAG